MKFHSDMTFLELSFPRPTYISVSTPIVSDLISVKYIIPYGSVLSFILSVVMGILMAGIVTAINTGFDSGYPGRWLRAFAMAMPIAFVCIQFLGPLARKLTDLLTDGDDDTGK